jgi:hypothetical protein
MANRYFERAKELEQKVRFQSTPVLHYKERRRGSGIRIPPLSLSVKLLRQQAGQYTQRDFYHKCH